jgi:hypothetical protein
LKKIYPASTNINDLPTDGSATKRRAAQKQAAPKNEFHQDQSGFLYTIAEAV